MDRGLNLRYNVVRMPRTKKVSVTAPPPEKKSTARKVKIKMGEVDENGIYTGKPFKERLKNIDMDHPWDKDWIYERQEDGSFKRMWFRGLH